jgi:hypothetical protein
MEKNRQTAILILGKFERLLDKYGIVIPDENRMGEPDEACLYGANYYALEDEITDLLNKIERESLT